MGESEIVLDFKLKSFLKGLFCLAMIAVVVVPSIMWHHANKAYDELREEYVEQSGRIGFLQSRVGELEELSDILDARLTEEYENCREEIYGASS